ncbi:MAG: hypothetical protein RSH26_06280, partial [Clostridia bacterium]
QSRNSAAIPSIAILAHKQNLLIAALHFRLRLVNGSFDTLDEGGALAVSQCGKRQVRLFFWRGEQGTGSSIFAWWRGDGMIGRTKCANFVD